MPHVQVEKVHPALLTTSWHHHWQFMWLFLNSLIGMKMEACFLFSLPTPPWHLLLLSEVLPTLLIVILAQMCSRNDPESPECSCLISVPCSFSGSFSNLTPPSEAVLYYLHLQLTCQLRSLPAFIPWPCTELLLRRAPGSLLGSSPPLSKLYPEMCP